MKPMLIIPPAPARWPALRALLKEEGEPWTTDHMRRLVDGVAGAQDAYAVIPSGGQFLASVSINKIGDLGVLGHGYTHPDHRRRGYARRLMDTILSWFEMTGGKWLLLRATTELDESFYRKFDFRPLRRAVWTPYDRLTMLRTAKGASDDPLAGVEGAVQVRDVTRAEWPAMVAFLQFRNGPDPRVPLEESAVSAHEFTLDLIDHQERGACRLKGAFRGPCLLGLASVAMDRYGGRTYALLLPHTDAPTELRQAVIESACDKGYEGVDFPMEVLGRAVAGGLARPAST